MTEKQDILKRYFGHDAFRPGQEEIIDALLAGRDVLAVMPTGAGKSLCYQVPAMMLTGITLVISPLISLMKDQVTALNAAGMPAAYLNSTLTQAQMDKALSNAYQGKYRFIYVAPERLAAPTFIRFCAQAAIALIAVDEAHCVSQWGQDFRPSYLKIAEFFAQLPKRPPVGAFTATATQKVSDDIQQLLQLRNPIRVTTGFDRPNLFFEILQQKKRTEAVIHWVLQHPSDSGIIYCSSRKQVEDLSRKLCEAGITATRYHAGLSDEERKTNQEDFQYDRARVMVATNAFGMGIDKSNVRYVLHAQMPRSIEAYYQEAGRAGRDGEPAECVLFYNRQDIIISRFLIDRGEPNEALSDEERQTVRRQEYQRLNRMVDLCEGTECIRNGLLRYFGQKTAGGPCGLCSRCAGSRASEVLRQPVTPSAAVVDAAPTPVSSVDEDGLEDLIIRLKACRITLAKQERMPAYIVCDDKTLRNMAQLRPSDIDGLSRVQGIGEVKLRKYGQAFLQTIAEWRRIHPEWDDAPDCSQPPADETPEPDAAERVLLDRCRQAQLTVRQAAILLAQPEKVVEKWLVSVPDSGKVT